MNSNARDIDDYTVTLGTRDSTAADSIVNIDSSVGNSTKDPGG